MLIDADHATLDHGEYALNRVGVDNDLAFASGVFLAGMLDRTEGVELLAVSV